MQILILQGVILIYTFSTVCAKMASGETMFSVPFFIYLGLEIVILGIYAVLWQQVIKKIDLSIAYLNKAMALLWSMLWSFLFFKEKITLNNMIGIAIILIGVYIINSKSADSQEQAEPSKQEVKENE